MLLLQKMSLEKGFKNLDWFSLENSNNLSFQIYDWLVSDENIIERFWDSFSDFYYISCSPYKIEEWKNEPEIYRILQRCKHMADNYPLEILIGKYSEEAMSKAKKITQIKRKEFEWSWIIVLDPKQYIYIVWFFWWTSGRNNQYIIEQIKKNYPYKFWELKRG